MNNIEDDQAAEVMTILAALDRWLQVTDEQAHLWANVLNAKKVRLADAQEAAYRLITNRPKADATPGLLIGEVRDLRRERIRAAGDDALVPPDDLRPGGYPQWLRAAKHAVADGMPVAVALEAADLEVGVTRRQIGPPVARTIPTTLGRSA